MPFWVYGRDARSGQRTDPFFSDAADEATARAEASAQGMIVESVEPDLRAAGSEAAAERPAAAQYEFRPEQKQAIAGLAWYMRIVGGALVIFGGFQLVVGLTVTRQENASLILQGILGLAIGGLTAHAAAAFQRIVDTRGRDIDHLMGALDRLTFIYAIQVLLLGVALVAAVFILVRALPS